MKNKDINKLSLTELRAYARELQHTIYDLQGEIGQRDAIIQGLEDKVGDLECDVRDLQDEIEGYRDELGEYEREEEDDTKRDAYNYWRSL